MPHDPPVIDTRPDTDFRAAHAAGAAGIPLEELPRRVHELPPASEPLSVSDANPSRAERAAEFLRRRGHDARAVAWDPAAQTEAGASRIRLWRPTPFLVEAIERIRAEGAAPARGDRRARRALDVACGSGRDAAFLALSGYDVEALDVLPDAVERATDLARRCGVTVRASVRDLECSPEIPVAAYELVTVFRYLQRDLFRYLREAVVPGGFIAYETFHERTGLTGRRPQSPGHLLANGELARAFAGFDILVSRDAIEHDGRFFSRLLARRHQPEAVRRTARPAINGAGRGKGIQRNRPRPGRRG